MHKLRERLLCGGLGEGGAEEGAAPLTSQSIIEQSSAGSKFRRPSLATVATLPSAVVIEHLLLAASWVFSFQPALQPDFRPPFYLAACGDRSWARRLTQSPELGFGLRIFFLLMHSSMQHLSMQLQPTFLALRCGTVGTPLQ